MRKLIAVAVLLAASSARAGDFTVAEFTQGLLDPQVVAGVAYNEDTKKFQAVLTANLLGFKAGTLPVYIGGIGVSLNTVAPGLENAPFAATSIPFLTVAPWGESVVIQVGMTIPIGGGLDVGNSYYGGVGVSVSGGPNAIKAKRIKRIEAKKAKRAALNAGPPGPVS